MSFPKYPKYQDTGLTWFAEAPEHWRVIAPKRVMKSCSGGTLIKGECAAEPEEGLFPAFSASGQDVWVERADYSAPGIVLSAVGARCGKTFKADGEWGVVANTHCLFPEGNQSRDFFWHLTNREDWWETGGTAQPFVKVRETLARTWCLPPANEQRCISNFLDRETAKIDALIAEQQRLIELLQEKRQAVISHAVTKGLNPNAPMKDSGVEWLGKVPKHWGVRRLRHIGTLQNGLNISGDAFGEGDPFISYGDVYKNPNVPQRPAGLVRSAPEDKQRYGLERGDVLFTRTSETVDDIGVASTCLEKVPHSTFAGFLIRLRPFRGVLEPGYSTHLFRNQGVKTHFAGTMNIVTRASLSQGELGNLAICLPPLDEQLKIASAIDEMVEQSDQLISSAWELVALLQERRSALISAAVTGQIDVRGLVEGEGSKQ